MPRSEQAQRLYELLQPTVERAELSLEDVVVRTLGKRRTIEVYLDLPEQETGSLGLDRIEEITPAISDALDLDPEDDGTPYDLEISSPGVDRPLTNLRHWRRALGRMVNVTLEHPWESTAAGAVALLPSAEHPTVLRGRLVAVHPDAAELRAETQVKKGMKPRIGAPVPVEFSAIRHAAVDVEFAAVLDSVEEQVDAADWQHSEGEAASSGLAEEGQD
ncbi:ribosome maturation factor RimP [Psychromicrobium xiongbiense]|uniref:ribosome maturation factor RimP n=1 Tax=Psychromicrobium xiongbiense TaxID=3051184 RepID=UPI0025562BD0|nr:ribosome maturation factor RimP [Psychromicrobium sp. YIM S02556]